MHCNSRLTIAKICPWLEFFAFGTAANLRSLRRRPLSALVVLHFCCYFCYLDWHLKNFSRFKIVEAAASTLSLLLKHAKPCSLFSEKLVMRVILAWFVIQCEFHVVVGKRVWFLKWFNIFSKFWICPGPLTVLKGGDQNDEMNVLNHFCCCFDPFVHLETDL